MNQKVHGNSDNLHRESVINHRPIEVLSEVECLLGDRSRPTRIQMMNSFRALQGRRRAANESEVAVDQMLIRRGMGSLAVALTSADGACACIDRTQ